MTLYRDEGVVLRTHKLGEADRIITVLTRHNGRVRAVAKGVRRTSSKFGARLEPFHRVDLQLYLGRSGLDTVTQAVTIEGHNGAFGADYRAYTAASAVCETVERLTAEEREPAPELFLLLTGALRALAAAEHDPSAVLDSFLLRALALSGYQPALDTCAVCGRPGPHAAFSIPSGGACCDSCRPPGAAHPPPATLRRLRALADGDWEVVDAAETRPTREASGIVAAYLQFHLERGLRSLPLVERV